MYGYIYKTTNLINGKIYVGQHRCKMFDPKYYGSGLILKKAIKKYGIENFICEMIECCDTKIELEEKEIHWIARLNSCNNSIGYNRSYGGFTPRYHGSNHPMYGRHHSIESRLKNSESHKGKKHSKETNAKRVDSRRRYYELRRIRCSEEWIRAKHRCEYCNKIMIKKYASGRFCDIECAHKYQASTLRGRKMSEETKQKMVDSHKNHEGFWKGKHRNEETINKISKALSGKKRLNRRIVYEIDNIIFSGLNEGADYFNITTSCMSIWIKNGHTNKGVPITIIVDNQLKKRKDKIRLY